MRFRNREHAGQEIARLIGDAVARPCVIGAIPRGGVAVGLPLAEALEAPLVVVNAHKLTAPVAPEFAFGAIDEDGEILLDRTSVHDLGLDPQDVEDARRRAAGLMRARIERLGRTGLASLLPAAVVLVDDGLATGLTMLAACRHARRHGAAGITVAVPCASREAAEAIRHEADKLVCPIVDPAFMAVGEYYEDFSQVSDEEMDALLARADLQGRPVRPPAGPPGAEH